MAKKKITRKQLLKEPDEFLTLSTRLFRFVMENRGRVGVVMGGLLALAVAIAGFQYYQYRMGNRAFQELAEVRDRYAAASRSGYRSPGRARRYHRFQDPAPPYRPR